MQHDSPLAEVQNMVTVVDSANFLDSYEVRDSAVCTIVRVSGSGSPAARGSLHCRTNPSRASTLKEKRKSSERVRDRRSDNAFSAPVTARDEDEHVMKTGT